MRRRGGRKRAIGTRASITLSLMPNQCWSLDIVSDQLTDGRRFRVVTLVENCRRECLPLIADTSPRVAQEVATLIEARGKPVTVVSYNGMEFTLNAYLIFADDRKIDWHYIAPGKPAQSAFIVGFNGRPARRALERDAISSMSRARAMLAAWHTDNDTERPHSLLRWQTPAVFSQTFVPQRGPTSGN